MSLEIAIALMSSITSLVSIIKKWQSMRKVREKHELEKESIYMEGDVHADVPKEIPEAEPSEASKTLSKVIPEDILKAILDNINKAKERFIKAIDDPVCNRQCEDQEHVIASATICGELERIKRLNNRQLPKDLEILWISFQCD